MLLIVRQRLYVRAITDTKLNKSDLPTSKKLEEWQGNY